MPQLGYGGIGNTIGTRDFSGKTEAPVVDSFQLLSLALKEADLTGVALTEAALVSLTVRGVD